MGVVKIISLGAVGLVVALLVYVRLAPSDPARWHQQIEAVSDQDLPGGAVRIVAGGAVVFARVDAALQRLPRTVVLAGSVPEGRVTYVTRSAVFAFPDYTTVEQAGDQVKLYGRLRFGASDMGVNRDRLERVLAAVEGG